MLSDRELAVLGALAETLIPETDTPGADLHWAKTFLVRHVGDDVARRTRFRALAAHVEMLARDFDQLPVAARERLLRARHPSLADDPALTAQDRDLRGAMRDMMVGFLTADGLDIHTDPYALDPGHPRRDRATPSTADHAVADEVPDVVIDRRLAMWDGAGTYARVWRAAGYPVSPGQPQPPDDLVALRPRHRDDDDG